MVRTASRRAARSDAPWHAVYVETLHCKACPNAQRRAILRTLKLAESLGATTATLSGQDAALAAVAYAREHQLGTSWRSRPACSSSRWRCLLRRSFGEQVAALAPEIELMLLAPADEGREPAARAPAQERSRSTRPGAVARLRLGTRVLRRRHGTCHALAAVFRHAPTS